ncbi:MAG TPA: hypothetical protein VF515_03515 [Candidatus Binatia bacterium]
MKQGGGAPELIDRLRLQVGRLAITPEELEGRNQRSALFKTMFLAFRRAGAKDWRSNLTISLDHSGAQHRLQFHHIFPKAVLKSAYTAREADDIANLAFIGGKTNRAISDKAPTEYFPALIAKAGARGVRRAVHSHPRHATAVGKLQGLSRSAQTGSYATAKQVPGDRLVRSST